MVGPRGLTDLYHPYYNNASYGTVIRTNVVKKFKIQNDKIKRCMDVIKETQSQIQNSDKKESLIK